MKCFDKLRAGSSDPLQLDLADLDFGIYQPIGRRSVIRNSRIASAMSYQLRAMS